MLSPGRAGSGRPSAWQGHRSWPGLREHAALSSLWAVLPPGLSGDPAHLWVLSMALPPVLVSPDPLLCPLLPAARRASRAASCGSRGWPRLSSPPRATALLWPDVQDPGSASVLSLQVLVYPLEGGSRPPSLSPRAEVLLPPCAKHASHTRASGEAMHTATLAGLASGSHRRLCVRMCFQFLQ